MFELGDNQFKQYKQAFITARIESGWKLDG
jgi:hypothetical protein